MRLKLLSLIFGQITNTANSNEEKTPKKPKIPDPKNRLSSIWIISITNRIKTRVLEFFLCLLFQPTVLHTDLKMDCNSTSDDGKYYAGAAVIIPEFRFRFSPDTAYPCKISLSSRANWNTVNGKLVKAKRNAEYKMAAVTVSDNLSRLT